MSPILFVDGENLVMRYQAMKAAGRTPHPDVAHVQDTYVWTDGISQLVSGGFARVCYYSTVVGDDVLAERIRGEIASQFHGFGVHPHPTTKYQPVPFVFKKAARSEKTRTVDIQIVIDIMRAATQASFGPLVLASGDGDYLPVLAEAMRLGKQVVVAAFSSGINPLIPRSVDKFISLDHYFFSNESVA